MSRVFVWLWLTVGTTVYCYLRPGYMAFNELAASIYFSGAALLLHWGLERLSSMYGPGRDAR